MRHHRKNTRLNHTRLELRRFRTSAQRTARNARSWMNRLTLSDESDRALRRLGCYFADSIARIKNPAIDRNFHSGLSLTVLLPADLVQFPRKRLLVWCNSPSQSTSSKFVSFDRVIASTLLGGLALSYANEYDLLAVSRIVRKAASMRLYMGLLQEAVLFLLHQQYRDGYFGLYGGMGDKLRTEPLTTLRVHVRLRLTVEVLWAIENVVQLGVPVQLAKKVVV